MIGTPDCLSQPLEPELNRDWNQDTDITAVCMHGNSRSKAVAAACRQLGYTHTRAIGVRDPNEPGDLQRILTQSDVLIVVQEDVHAELKKLLGDRFNPSKVVLVPITNNEHHALTQGNEMQKKAVKTVVKERLIKFGFVDITERSKELTQFESV